MTSSIFSLGNIIRVFLLVGLFGVLFVLVQSCQRPKSGLEHYAKDSLKKLTVRENSPHLPETIFQTVSDRKMTLNEYGGKTVLLNVWATWCAPCIKEMPSLDRLQKLRGGDDFQVITISIDRTKYEPAKFFADNGIENLIPWHDGSFGIPGNLQLRGYPTTLIYNPNGREIAVLEGDAEWDSDESLALIDYLIVN